MKKALANTRVSVKLRKSEYREEWYLYVEAYPDGSLLVSNEVIRSRSYVLAENIAKWGRPATFASSPVGIALESMTGV